MELHTQIKKYRTHMHLSQEDLAQKVYVTRQTVSNWETGKNYPDIHSLLLLSALFHISLDQLIKGDIKMMREEIDNSEIRKFHRDGTIFTAFLLLSTLSVVPLAVFWGYWGLAISAILWGIAMYYACKIEKYKKNNNIQTYKEILAFTEGKRLDEIERARELGKRPYQKVALALICALVAVALCLLSLWLFQSFIF